MEFNEKIIDFTFLYDYLENYINEFKLQDYVYNIKIDNDTEKLGEYDFINKTLLIGLKSNILFYERQLNKINKNNALNLNTFILNTVIHELTHAIQYKKANEENNILYINSFENIKLFNNIYLNHHDLFLIEHNAIVRSLIETKKYTDKFENDAKIDLLNQLKFFIKNQYKNASPYEKITQLIKREEIIDFTNFSFEDKVKLGLPIK